MAVLTISRRANKEGGKAIKTKVFEILDAKGIKRKWLAEQLGISASYLSMIESGAKPISEKFIQGCCQALQLPRQVLFIDTPQH